MERSEPTLVPQWLKNAGVTGSGNSSNHFASSSHSDVSLAHHTRNRTSKSISDFDSPRSTFLDRSFSSDSRRNSSNGSAKHAYSSFNRSHRDKDREKDKDRPSFGDIWDHDSADLSGNLFPTWSEDTLRRSHPMVSRKLVDILPQRVASDLTNCNNGNQNNANGVLSGCGIGGSIPKAVSDKDFPSLVTDERQGVPDIVRVSSPCFSTAVQSLPSGNLTLIGGEGRTSALAELPTIVGSCSSGSFSAQQAAFAPTSPGSGVPSATAGLNMAEALAQAPSRTRVSPQLSVNTQRLEELAIKQSRQLIPVIPVMPKASVSSDKSKPKTSARTGEMSLQIKGGQPQSSSLPNASQPLRGGSVKSDAPKTSHGKFQVLKPVWENGVSPSSKDVTSATNNSNSRAVNSPVTVATPVASVPSRSPNSQKLSSVERKAAALNLKPGPMLERKPSLSQVQSRNDFFNLLKKKTSLSSSNPDSGSNNSSPTNEKYGEIASEVSTAPASTHTIEDGADMSGNDGCCEEVQRFPDGEKNTYTTEAVYLDEEEAAFLRSLGWEENGDDEGLTEEEINAFYEKCSEVRPSFKVCRGMQLKLSMLSESHASSLSGAPSELSSSDT